MKKIIVTLLVVLGIHQVNGQTNSFPSTGNAKIFAVGESWAEGLSIVRSSGWSGVRIARNDPAGGNYNGNWALGYYGNSNDFSLSTVYSGTQYDGILHLSNSTRNVGIGTTSPQSLLHLNSTDDARKTFRVYWNNDLTKYLSVFQGTTGAAIDPIGTGVLSLGYDQITNVLINGKLGIGTTSPSQKLDVNGNINMAGAAGRRLFMGGFGGSTFGLAYDAYNPDYGIFYTEGNTDYISLSPNGNSTNGILNVFGDGKVGIGTAHPDYPLTVNGSIHSKEVRVDLNVPAPDYVFEKEYQLTSLEDIKNYIDQNKHLPEVPPAKEMEKNGVQLGEMNMLLLKKIEELTLHVIEQNKRLTNLEAENKELKSLIKK